MQTRRRAGLQNLAGLVQFQHPVLIKELWCKYGVSRWSEKPEVRVRLPEVPQTIKKEV